jgi:hypothetical protein
VGLAELSAIKTLRFLMLRDVSDGDIKATVLLPPCRGRVRCNREIFTHALHSDALRCDTVADQKIPNSVCPSLGKFFVIRRGTLTVLV